MRWENEKYTALKVPKASVRGIGNGTMRVENLTIKEAENAENPIKPGDWVVISDPLATFRRRIVPSHRRHWLANPRQCGCHVGSGYEK